MHTAIPLNEAKAVNWEIYNSGECEKFSWSMIP